MKITNEVKEQMKRDIKVVLFHLANKQGLDVKTMDFPTSLIHALWFRTYCCVAYPISNPNCLKDSKGERLLPFNEDYELYPCDTNDTTIETTLKRILTEIQKES